MINKVLEDIPADKLLDVCQKKLCLSNQSESGLNYSGNCENFVNECESVLSSDEALAMFIDAKLTK